jgi:hypothetical protein
MFCSLGLHRRTSVTSNAPLQVNVEFQSVFLYCNVCVLLYSFPHARTVCLAADINCYLPLFSPEYSKCDAAEETQLKVKAIPLAAIHIHTAITRCLVHEANT